MASGAPLLLLLIKIEVNVICQDQENGEKCVACQKATDLGH
ncbi:hypothetical protein UF75_0538 [Desulfosporosinus sp. I2]|nr:hypothetical protein UF75_0538 [Desulfosporosinus sp. I2]